MQTRRRAPSAAQHRSCPSPRSSAPSSTTATTLDFDIGWIEPDKEIGSVSNGETTIFFRKRQPPFEPAVHWVYAADIDAIYVQVQSSGAKIVDPLEKKPWGLWQFTIQDLDGNLFHFHHG